MDGGGVSEEEGRFCIRRLEPSDYAKGFIELLSQLTVCPPFSADEFRSRFDEIRALGDHHVICVIEDSVVGRLVAAGTVFVEMKFVRGCGKVGHVEDVVVDSDAHGRHLGQKVVGFLCEHARAVGCYKVILDCNDKNRGFYERCGFRQKELQMALYFD